MATYWETSAAVLVVAGAMISPLLVTASAAAVTWVVTLVGISVRDVGVSWQVHVNCSLHVSAALFPVNCRGGKLRVPQPEVQHLIITLDKDSRMIVSSQVLCAN